MNLNEIPNGTILKNSSKAINGFKYNHAFDGHGLLNAFKIHDGQFYYKGIRVKTHQYNLEKKFNAQIFRGLNTNVKFNPLFINDFSNISVLVHNDEVQSYSEGGMPYLIDIDNGHCIGPKHNIPLLPYIPLSAHPKIYNNIVYNFSCYLVGLSLFNDNGIIFNEVFKNNETYYSHDFAISENYYIFYLNSVNVNLFDIYSQRKSLLESISLLKNNKILLVHKKTLKRTYINVPNNFDHNALHIAHIEECDRCITMFMCFIPDSFSLSSVKNAYEFEHCYLHKLIISKEHNFVEIKKLIYTEYGEMPVYNDKTNDIYLINQHNLLKYNVNDSSLKKINFECQSIEEPVLHEDFLYVIGHFGNETYLHIINTISFELIYTHCYPFKTPYGFHGGFKSNYLKV